MVIVYFLQLETRTGDDCLKRGAVGTSRSICGLPIKNILLLLAKCAKTIDELLIGRSLAVTLMLITYTGADKCIWPQLEYLFAPHSSKLL